MTRHHTTATTTNIATNFTRRITFKELQIRRCTTRIIKRIGFEYLQCRIGRTTATTTTTTTARSACRRCGTTTRTGRMIRIRIRTCSSSRTTILMMMMMITTRSAWMTLGTVSHRW